MSTVTIAHGEDPDGLTCAALLLHLRGAKVLLANYDDFEEKLASVEPPTRHVYICDLNIRGALLPEIMRIRGFSEVTVIDHHAMAEGVKERLEDSGVTVVLDLRDCSSAILYDLFEEELDRRAARLAAYAAVSDMFEEGPVASRLLARFDTKFVQHEALILTHSLFEDSSPEFRNRIIEGLSRFEYPHRMRGVPEAALAYLEEMARVMETLPGRVTRLGRLAYVEALMERSTGSVANLVMDTMGVDVGVCYKENGPYYNVSLRGEKGLEEDLGEIARRLGERHGGFGGGHKRAAGAKVPRAHLMGFIEDLSEELGE